MLAVLWCWACWACWRWTKRVNSEAIVRAYLTALPVITEDMEYDVDISDDQEQAMDCRVMTLGGIRQGTTGPMSQESQQQVKRIQGLSSKERTLLLS